MLKTLIIYSLQNSLLLLSLDDLLNIYSEFKESAITEALAELIANDDINIYTDKHGNVFYGV